jgi:hypothetical protein
MAKNEVVDLACKIEHETEKAWLLDFGVGKPVWVPKSKVEIETKDNRSAIATMPTWLAEEKGIV